MGTTRRKRIVWFADTATLADDPAVLERLRDEAGLTTVAPESSMSHTSGFRASGTSAQGRPFRDWRERPGLAEHRTVFGVREPAMAVLPGIVDGVDDAPLLHVIEACRRLGLEVWGHAGLWCYGAELYPELAVVDLFGRGPLPASLPWGTMFCPSRPELDAWLKASLAEAAAAYDLDGWFLDHARHPSPGYAAGMLACACQHCASAAAALGTDLEACRRDVRAFVAGLTRLDAAEVIARGEQGPVGLVAWLARYPGVAAWLEVRAAILADRFARIGTAIRAASDRDLEIGSDVFPPSVALLGGHDHDRWARTATWLTGGFGPRISWDGVSRVTVLALAGLLARLVPGLGFGRSTQVVGKLLGADDPVDDATAAYRRELRALGARRPDVAVYPPLPMPPSREELAERCAAIVEAGLDGAVVAGLEASDADMWRILRTELMERVA